MSKNSWNHWWPVLAVLGSVTALGLGTSLAKQLFPLVGAQGTSALRVGFAALILVCVWRPWRWSLNRQQAQALLIFGMALGGMNLMFYMALRDIPFGLAVAIEFSGPLAVAIYYSRRALDFVWLALAVAGLAMILPLGGNASDLNLSPVGIACALGAAICWASYIVLGRRLGHIPSGQAVSLGLLCAALVVVPFGVAEAGLKLLTPSILLFGLMVAAISSALPYTLEMLALRRLPPATFGIALATEPAIAALMGMLLLSEHLSATQWTAIACIMAAAMGSAVTRPGSKPPAVDASAATSG
ncbi:Threonine/homoserine exporter RhtA [Comamonas sp. PE63]|uniref:Threonine/homoserine exporter RhtA n=1 Tax=Comamonas brasiliensis TaxID=1812482 RepID=A0ABS5LPJ0_9BURK|nr:EamA family transporter [Comamonas sp. PE63]MBS3018022.1 Threonine/homoserine exporter RhtA [Comamonas sp. PE63]